MTIKQQGVKYGAFHIYDDIGYWNRDHEIQVKLTESPSEACQKEGFWNPGTKQLQTEYDVAMTGLCIWSKYDCLFKFQKRSKGNPGAERSFSNPKDRADLLKRLEEGHKIEQVTISGTPFGLYQSKLITWQAHTLRRFNIHKLYYALPVEEYMMTLSELRKFLPHQCVEEIIEILNKHHDLLAEKICNEVEAEVQFIHPMRHHDISVIDSYVWPYLNLDIDLGIEEMEEIRIPYQAWKRGAEVPPILLGMLGVPCPYYERREYQEGVDDIYVFP